MNGLVRGSVLVGDDEARIAEVVASYRGRASCQTRPAGDGLRALEPACARRPDLVLGLRLGTEDHASRVLVAATVLLRRLRARIERHPARPRHGQTGCGAGHRLPP
jgi:hypothetical protein